MTTNNVKPIRQRSLSDDADACKKLAAAAERLAEANPSNPAVAAKLDHIRRVRDGAIERARKLEGYNG